MKIYTVLFYFIFGLFAGILVTLILHTPGEVKGCTTEDMVCYDDNTNYPFKQNNVVHEQCHGLVFNDYEHFCGWKE
jgi:hypothetical protein